MTRVVKLGGSLAAATQLVDWLRVLANADDVVIVPGGGPFADHVRAAQRRWGFDDTTAHRMAIFAMEQFGLMLAALAPGTCAARTLSELRDNLDRGRSVIWLPATLLAFEPGIEGSWRVTSDSIAAWVATRLGAERLILVKSAEPLVEPVSIAALQSAGVIDAAFHEFMAGRTWRLGIAHRDRSSLFTDNQLDTELL